MIPQAQNVDENGNPYWTWKNYPKNLIVDDANLLLEMVDSEVELVPNKDSSRVFISGYSMGCRRTNAAFVMYNGSTRLGGVACLSGYNAFYYVNPPWLPPSLATTLKAHQETPFLYWNGMEDTIVVPEIAKPGYDWYLSEIYSGNYTTNIEDHWVPRGIHWPISNEFW